jgi:putative redox protein
MARQRFNFAGTTGELAGSLETPATKPHAYALFAHCFTCGKDSAAASRISRTLAANGIGVLRFDFTGLGGSDGDFANTGFSSNIEDLVAAADHLRATHEAPALLIGHSLGGTAVLAAAERIPEAKAVVTIGSPATPGHVIKQFAADVERIERDGEAEVQLAGRPFRIRRSFLDDLRSAKLEERIRRLRRAILVMHAPFDTIVSIDEAGTIFQSAMHPKSFLSLDKADHLLTAVDDAQYAANTQVGEGNRKFLRHVASDDHAWLADEPLRVGGDNLGPDPYEHLLAALGACTSMTVRMYANGKDWPLENIDVALEHSREHATDCEGCEQPGAQIDVIRRTIRLEGDLDPEQRRRLLQIADRCPVHRTLRNEVRLETEAAK